ncbi:hypothetical protein ACKTEK_03530 [Tepidamorphus sp. 3E244]|uniref:hypothetical protein n=1 Tax=Tepidamorphus sp. 3E244 TaxID=3385498 RepID=UPI0038FCFD83
MIFEFLKDQFGIGVFGYYAAIFLLVAYLLYRFGGHGSAHGDTSNGGGAFISADFGGGDGGGESGGGGD